MPSVDISDPNCPLPDYLLFDASIVLAFKGFRSNPHQLAVNNFGKRFGREAIAGNIEGFIPILTLEECYFKLIQYHFSKEARKQNTTWHQLYKDKPSLISQVLPILNQLRSDILGIPLTILNPEELCNLAGASAGSISLEAEMLNQVQQSKMLPKDAYLIAIAKYLQIPHIATLDGDFKRVKGLTIYTVS